MVNELYLSILYRPAAGVARSFVAKALGRARTDLSRLELLDALETCEKLATELYRSAARYEPERLSGYTLGGRRYRAC